MKHGKAKTLRPSTIRYSTIFMRIPRKKDSSSKKTRPLEAFMMHSVTINTVIVTTLDGMSLMKLLIRNLLGKV
jgi:hypothetical protein